MSVAIVGLSEFEASIAKLPLAVGLVDPDTGRYVAANERLHTLLGFPRQTLIGEPFSTTLPPELRERAMQQQKDIATGKLESYEAPRKLLTKSGKEIAGVVSVRRLSLNGSPPLLMGIFQPTLEQTGQLERLIFGNGQPDVACIVTDHDWTIRYVSSAVGEVFDLQPDELVSKPLLGSVHPTAASELLAAITRAITTKRAVTTHAQMQTGSGWQHALCLVTTLCNHSPPRLGLMVAQMGTDQESIQPSRTQQLEQRMWRIAGEVLAADLMQAPSHTLTKELTEQIAELTSQQWEITMRLIRGERVPAIARAMHLSQSTVRNHLTAVFRRFGVHSQVALIAKLKEPSS